MAKKTKAQLAKELRPITNGAEAKEFRTKSGMNQKDFWARVGVTQSGGSRYESGRDAPDQVWALLSLLYAPVDRVGEITTAMRANNWFPAPAVSHS